MTRPSWAEQRDADNGFIEYTRHIGSVTTVEGAVIDVDLVQTMTEGQTTAPQIRIDGHRYDIEAAAALVDALVTALRLMSGPGATPP